MTYWCRDVVSYKPSDVRQQICLVQQTPTNVKLIMILTPLFSENNNNKKDAKMPFPTNRQLYRIRNNYQKKIKNK